MRFLTTILAIFLFSAVGNAQSDVVPVIEMKIKGLLGGAQHDKRDNYGAGNERKQAVAAD